MGSTEASDAAAAFTEDLLRTGVMLFGLASSLVGDPPAEGCPGEEPGAVVIDSVKGTIRPALGAAEERELEDATDLIAAARDRVLEHLELALALSRRIHGGNRPSASRADG